MILLDKGFEIKNRKGRIALTLCGEMVLLKTKVPSFDTSWWSGLSIVENSTG